MSLFRSVLAALSQQSNPLRRSPVRQRKWSPSLQTLEVRTLLAAPTVTELRVAGDTLLPNEQLVTPPTNITVGFSEAMATTGAADVTNPANWGLTFNGNVATNQFSGISFGLNGTNGQYEAQVAFTSPLVPGDYVLTVKDSVTNLAGEFLDGDTNGAAGTDFIRNINVRQPQRVGAEFQVNTTTAFEQYGTAVASDSAGNYVVVWTSDRQDEYLRDGFGNDGVFGQLYAADGTPRGGEFQINTYVRHEQRLPDVAMSPNGDFVVVWESNGQDTNSYGIFGQRFFADGSRAGGEFRANTTVSNNQWRPSAAMDANGNFVVTWTAWAQGGDLYNEEGVYGQRFLANGTKSGGEFHIDTHTVGRQFDSEVAMDAIGNFAVVWVSNGQEGIGDSVYAQRFDAAGNKVGSEFRVNDVTHNGHDSPSIAMDAVGNFAITWSGTLDGTNREIYAKRYDAQGSLLGGEFRINTQTNLSQTVPSIAMDADGDFAVTWASDSQDGDRLGVYGQRYAANGSPLGGEFRVNSFTANVQTSPSLAMNADGDFIVAWTSITQDGDAGGIYAQRYAGGTVPIVDDQAFSISENPLNGAIVGTVAVTDPDAGETFTFSITGGNTGNVFHIDSATGQLTVADASLLDFETRPTWTLTVRVTDSGMLTDTATITINLNDVNDAPILSGAVANQAVNDNATINPLAPLTVRDADQQPMTASVTIENGVNRGDFTVASRTNWTRTVNGPDIVYTRSFPAAENIGAAVQTAVRALMFQPRSNVLLPGLTETTGFAVTVDDGIALAASNRIISVVTTSINDAPVVMPRTYLIGENNVNQLLLGNMVAFDLDFDAGQTRTFAITAGNTNNAFILDPMSGVLTVNNSAALDFETTPVFNLTVTATDSGTPPLSGSATVTIILRDENDAPTVAPQHKQIAENSAPGTSVGTVIAGDQDLGQSRVYSIVAGNRNEAFAINPATGELTVNSSLGLNFENLSQLDLTIRVVDNGSPAKAGSGVVTVTVQDVNETPVVQPKQFLINENSAPGAFIGLVAVSDPDAGQSRTFAITGGNPGQAFAIHPMTGALTVNNSSALNFEASPQISLTVTATDNGTPALSSSANVTVFLRNVNEAPTLIGKDFLIGENSANSAFIGTLSASDPDVGQTRTFAITAGNTSNAFAIDPSTGVLSVRNSAALNYEQIQQFNLTVAVTDNGTPMLSKSAPVSVFLRDVNEAPSLVGKNFLIGENSIHNAFIGTLVASDPDVGQTRTFAITSGNTNNAFSIEPTTGVLRVNNSSALNYEALTQFNLTVTVTDNGSPRQSTSAPVTIFLRDVNESPVVQARNFLIAENSVNGAFIGTIAASDPDLGQTKTYSITGGNVNNAFSIDPTTGVLRVNNSAALDFETTPQFNLTVTVTDNGNPAKSGSATVTVFLRDVTNARSAVIRDRDTTSIVVPSTKRSIAKRLPPSHF